MGIKPYIVIYVIFVMAPWFAHTEYIFVIFESHALSLLDKRVFERIASKNHYLAWKLCLLSSTYPPIFVHVYLGACGSMRPLVGISSLLLSHDTQGSVSESQSWQQGPLHTELTFCSRSLLFRKVQFSTSLFTRLDVLFRMKIPHRQWMLNVYIFCKEIKFCF